MIRESIYSTSMIIFNFSKSKYKREVLSIIDKNLLSRYINKRCGRREVIINFNFISSSNQIKMNIDFKAHNYNTDILTFDLSESDCELTGDVYISLKQVRKNAKNYGVELREELNRVLIHGFLHLNGFNDETRQEKKDMRREENKYLQYLKRKCSTWNTCINHY